MELQGPSILGSGPFLVNFGDGIARNAAEPAGLLYIPQMRDAGHGFGARADVGASVSPATEECGAGPGRFSCLTSSFPSGR